MKMDINNEAHFLAKVNKTPSFLVYKRKYDSFFDLNIEFTKPKRSEGDNEKEDSATLEEKHLTGLIEKGIFDFI